MDYANSLTSYALIDLDALATNVRSIKAHIAQNCELIAVVKANAYGHGAIPVARAALAAGASRLAVARVDEGIALRRAGIDAPILLMGYAIPGEAPTIVRHHLTATVINMEIAQALSEAAKAAGRTATVHIKIDTGMGRFGLLPDEVLPFMEQISALPALDIEGIYTHFATSDATDKSYALQQFAVFAAVLNTLEDTGYGFRLRHTANSAAALDMPDTHLDAVRCGIALHGLHPSDEMLPAIPLHPTLTLKSHIARVRMLGLGSSVGYGRSFICNKPTRVALIPVGYGDGYHRALANKSIVLIGGQRCPVIGRISMDQITVDVTSIPDVQEGDEVVLIGTQGKEQISAEELGALASTNNYEVVTSLLARMPRVYAQGGTVVDVVRLAE